MNDKLRAGVLDGWALTRNIAPVAEVRTCEQCGAAFAPRREHARFCSARCRAAWNRENVRHHPAQATALDWSMTAMRDVTGRLWRVRAGDQARALAAISEAVWWVTIVDATLVRHHPDAYDQVLASQTPPQRQVLEGTLAGLRFVRNQMGHHLDPADFACPAPGRPGGDKYRLSAWIWKSLPEPPLASLPPSGRAWERARYRAYQAQLAGHPVGDTFGRAAAFLKLAAADADLHHEYHRVAAR
jgi:predicted nucleic acid-binding Zn ribbon protein